MQEYPDKHAVRRVKIELTGALFLLALASATGGLNALVMELLHLISTLG